MPTPRESIERTIRRWEGTYGNQAWDPGNWVTMPDGTRQIAGTKFGVTPAALAAHRGKHEWEMTAAVMKAMPLSEAVEIGETMFYLGTGIDQLPWGPSTDVLMDIGWGTGPFQAIKLMQRHVGVNADGRIGPLTIDAYNRWVARVGWEQAVRELCRVRIAFYEMLGRQDPKKYGPPQPGWKNRANWMTPEGLKSAPGEWWQHWQDNLPSLPVPAEIPPLPAPAVAQKPAPAAAEKIEGSGTTKALAGAGGIVGVLTSIAPAAVPHFFTADWRVVALLVGAGLIAGIAGLVIWRLHIHDRQVKAGG